MGGKILDYEAKTIRREGLEEGIRAMVSALKDLNIPAQTILEKLQEKFNLSLETAKKYV